MTTVSIHPCPVDKQARLRAALRATDEDVFMDEAHFRVIVAGRDDDGNLVHLGSIAMEAFIQHPRAMVEHVRFAPTLEN